MTEIPYTEVLPAGKHPVPKTVPTKGRRTIFYKGMLSSGYQASKHTSWRIFYSRRRQGGTLQTPIGAVELSGSPTPETRYGNDDSKVVITYVDLPADYTLLLVGHRIIKVCPSDAEVLNLVYSKGFHQLWIGF